MTHYYSGSGVEDIVVLPAMRHHTSVTSPNFTVSLRTIKNVLTPHWDTPHACQNTSNSGHLIDLIARNVTERTAILYDLITLFFKNLKATCREQFNSISPT